MERVAADRDLGRLVGLEGPVGAEDDDEGRQERMVLCAREHLGEDAAQRLEARGHLADVGGRGIAGHDEVLGADPCPVRVWSRTRDANQREGDKGRQQALHLAELHIGSARILLRDFFAQLRRRNLTG